MQRKLLLLICFIFLFSVPFFWLRPGEIDLGGDSSRLYFYDPIQYLKSYSLYAIAPNGIGNETIGFYLIPYIIFLYLLKTISFSSYLVITLLNSFSLIVAFFSIFGIIQLYFRQEKKNTRETASTYAGIIAGFFYVFSPLLIHVGWDKALFNHNQFFLNPLLFFLLLSYFLKTQKIYLLIAGIISFIFAPSFSPSPYFFSFFPLAFTYIAIYVHFIAKVKIHIKELFVFVFLSVCLHLFHIFPFIQNLFSVGSSLHTSAFTTEGMVDRGLGYFTAVASSTKFTNNLLNLAPGNINNSGIEFIWVIFPTLIFLGLIFQQKKEMNLLARKNMVLLTAFFLLTLFLATAVITKVGFSIYASLFSIPGFGMFRNYLGQFAHTFVFYYAFILGYALYYIFNVIQSYRKQIVLCILLLLVIFWTSFPFIRGDMINFIVNKGSKHEVKVPIVMDPEYEKVLNYIKNNSSDGKYLLLPIDDPGYQILIGQNGGAYQGPPTMAYLSEANVFSGAAVLFGEQLLKFVRDKNYERINSLLTQLNIKYIFYNSDPKIYDDTFETYPYAYARKFMPLRQELYKEFINLLGLKEKKRFGEYYHLYEINSSLYLPQVYVAQKVYHTNDFSQQAFSLPFLFNSVDNRFAIYSKNDKIKDPLTNEDNFIISATRKSDLFETFSKKTDSLLVTSSVPQDIYDLLHPFLVLPEKTVDEQEKVNRTVPFDRAVFSVENNIKHIEMELTKKKTGQFSDDLDLYKKNIGDLIAGLQRKNNTLFSSGINLYKLHTLLTVHENRLQTIIARSFVNTEQQKLISRAIQTVFQELRTTLGAQNTKLTESNYAAIIPVTSTYRIFVEKNKISSQAQSSMILTTDQFRTQPKSIQEEQNWIELDAFSLPAEQIQLKLTAQEYNPITTFSLFEKLNSIETVKYAANLKAEGLMLSVLNNAVVDLADWKPNTQYLVSFEYQTNANLSVNLLQWSTYQAIIETGDGVQSALMLVLSDDNELTNRPERFYQSSDIQVRNLSIIAVDYPQIILKHEKNDIRKMPQITISQINPTKYKVAVQNAQDPYTLVFQQGFNRNWKAYIVESRFAGERLGDRISKIFGNIISKTVSIVIKDSFQPPIGETYYNGDIQIRNKQNIFLSPQTFETWGYKPISEKAHYQVNGYANAWDISLSDTRSLTNYTLILELNTQRSFYPIFFLSVATALGYALYLIYLLWKKE